MNLNSSKWRWWKITCIYDSRCEIAYNIWTNRCACKYLWFFQGEEYGKYVQVRVSEFIVKNGIIVQFMGAGEIKIAKWAENHWAICRLGTV